MRNPASTQKTWHRRDEDVAVAYAIQAVGGDWASGIILVMENSKFVIVGGNPLRGEVRVGGAKNSVLKLMAASLLTPDECLIHNVPRITDVEIMV